MCGKMSILLPGADPRQENDQGPHIHILLGLILMWFSAEQYCIRYSNDKGRT